MLQSFRRSGGLSRAHCVTNLLAGRRGQHVDTLATWIVQSEVVHFEWAQETWLPMFQFDRASMEPSISLSRVLRELSGVFDPWETAQWFARPSLAIEGRTPADALKSDPDAVLQAARCDRYLVDA